MKNDIASPLDASTGAVLIEPYAHHEIHEGSAFTCTYNATIGVAGTIILRIKTPDTNKRVHMTWGIRCNAELNAQPIEGVTITGAGTAVTTFNRRRDELKTASTCLVYHTPTYSGGTNLPLYHLGNGPNGGEANHDTEWILARNTEYILLITSEAASNDVTVSLDWYEHKDKYI